MIFDFTTLQVIWWVMIGLVLIIYGATAGFDFGVTIISPFLKKNEERRVLLNTIAPTWDGNQTWLVFAGGALFVIWPVVYATIFSGLYAVMLFILWSFFLRPPGFDYRGKIASQTWRTAWDWALFISAFFPVLMFGLIFGNLLQGLPIHFDRFDLRSYYDGNFFGLLSPFALLCALTSLLMMITHGAAYLVRRTEGALQKTCKRNHLVFGLLFLLAFTLVGFMVAYRVKGYALVSSPVDPTAHPLDNVVTQFTGAWLHSYAIYPWKVVGPIVVYCGILLSFFTTQIKHGAFSFWANTVGVAGTIFSAGAALFPFIVPSSVAPSQSLTVWNATSAPFTLMGMFYVTTVLLTLILIYKIFSYATMWHRKGSLTIADVKENEHTFY